MVSILMSSTVRPRRPSGSNSGWRPDVVSLKGVWETQVHRRICALPIGRSLLLLAFSISWRHKYQPCSASFGRFFKWKRGWYLFSLCVTLMFSVRSEIVITGVGMNSLCNFTKYYSCEISLNVNFKGKFPQTMWIVEMKAILETQQ